MHRPELRALLAAALWLCASCTLEPSYERPTAPIASRWPEGEAYGPKRAGKTRTLAWQALVRAPGLRQAVQRALRNNRDLRVATANIRAARAQYQLARAGLAPRIGANASPVRGRLKRTIIEDYTLALGVSDYELDVFGRLRSLSHAAQETYLASEQGARSVRLTLIADTATAWLRLAAQRSLLGIARQTEHSASEACAIIRKRFEGGISSELDLEQAQTLVAQAQADVAESTMLLAQAHNALRLLVGAELRASELPSELHTQALPSELHAQDHWLAEVPVGLDSAVLLARPDVLEAEHLLKAANADIGAARAAFFPRLSLTGLTGLASSALSSLLSGGAFAWQVSADLTQPIFDGGANSARLKHAEAERAVSVAEYERVIQRAFREVADALARHGTIDAQLQAQRALLSAADASLRLAELRHLQGSDSYLAALDARRTSYDARRELLLLELTRAQNRVALYRVLGGS